LVIQGELTMDTAVKQLRTRPAGAEVVDAGVHFRVWSPRRQTVFVLITKGGEVQEPVELEQDDDGYFSALIRGAGPGDRYFLQVDDDPRKYPDPASCFQPEGVHGPSEVVESSRFQWTDQHWPGVTLKGQIIYEMHVGTWTPEGTWQAALEKLPHLAEIGISLVEVMPVAEFHGDFGWGYDGVYWYAPTRLYGRPDDFRAFVNRAHELGLGVILDVVYNHFGPTGNYAGVFSSQYITTKHTTEWGEAINFDAEGAHAVREFVAGNAAYWVGEFHLDGLRLDAIQAILDDSPQDIVADLTLAARAAARDRSILIFAEDEYQRAKNVLPAEAGGFALDGMWNDDFHHACRVAGTGHAEYYYADYTGAPQELISATRYGYLYQGQWNMRQRKFRGTPCWHVPAAHFVNALQNHDQVANSTHGYRGHQLTSPGRWRALTALQLLAPGTPLLFMGQEFMTSKPFLYFADHEVEIAELVRHGRWSFMRQFPRAAGASAASPLADPASRDTFNASKLDWTEAETNQQAVALHKDLLRLRREDPIFARQDANILHGAVIGPEALLLRWLDPDGDDRLIFMNLGRDLDWQPASQPLVAPPAEGWRILWSSEDPKYGGTGTALLDMKRLSVPGHALVVLAPDT
jgi:maltooligosyltrehalose trehalohydrolase